MILTGPDMQPPWCNFAYKGIFSVERGLNPWHVDALNGLAQYVSTRSFDEISAQFTREMPRARGWHLIDWCGNSVGFVADGEVFNIEEHTCRYG